MSNYKTEQEDFWAGEFGNEYITRNQSDQLLASNLQFFSTALSNIMPPKSCIEFGANIGMNLKALKLLFPHMELHANEINIDAAKKLESVVPKSNIFCQSLLDFTPSKTFDLVLIKGVLIHMNPKVLKDVYEKLVTSCNHYLLIAEYYNPEPVEIMYRGKTDRLFKRDFAGELMIHHKEMELCDYGFLYRKDRSFPQDDIHWFLLKKRIINR